MPHPYAPPLSLCSPYLLEGFMHLEKIVDESIYEWKTNNSVSITVKAKVTSVRTSSVFCLVMYFVLIPAIAVSRVRGRYLSSSYRLVPDFCFFVVSLIYTAGVIVKVSIEVY